MPAAIEVDLRDLDRAFRRMRRAGVDVRPAWRKLRPQLRADQRRHMSAMEGPSGAWRPLARSTVEKRMRVGGRSGKFTKKGRLRKPAQRRLARILSKRLLVKAKVVVTQDNMTITAQPKWAGIHQSGGIAGKNSRIPARVFMWVSRELQARAVRELELHLTDAFDGRTV